jgi:hypothetical protein
MLVITCVFFVCFSNGALLGQSNCNCSDYPVYRCITSGNLPDLINQGLLKSYATAENDKQFIFVGADVNFIDPNSPNTNTPYVFAPGSNIIMGSGATLSINKEVKFNGTVINSCDKWLGINVNNGGIIHLVNKSQLRNSKDGVNCSDGAQVEILDTYFENNFNCINMTGNVQLTGGGIAHNVFHGPDYTLGYTGVRYAINIVNVPQITIGNPTGGGTPNIFNTYGTGGILATSSNINVYNSEFLSSDLNELRTAIGVNSAAGSYTANVIGSSVSGNGDVTIENHGYGIDCNNGNLVIKDVNFSNTFFSINSMTNASRSFEVKDCQFDGILKAGIRIRGNYLNAKISGNTFHDNRVNDQFAARNCISWSGIMTGSNQGLITTNNFFSDYKLLSPTSPTYYHTGITLSAAIPLAIQNIKIEQNNFTNSFAQDKCQYYVGISLNSTSSRNTILNNNFTGNGVFSEASSTCGLFNRGIFANESGSNLIACNYIDNFDKGLAFQGLNCDRDTVRVNTFMNSNADLHLSSGTVIGKQIKNFNKWPSSGSTVEALFESPTQFLLLSSRFEIQNSNQFSQFWANPRDPISGWFVTSLVTNNEIDAACIDGTGGSGKSEANNQVINGTFEAYRGYPAYLEEGKIAAYRVLAQNSDLLQTGSADLQFYNTVYNNNTGRFGRILNQLEGLWHLNASNQSSLVQSLNNIESKRVALANTLDSFQQATNLTQQSMLEQQINQLVADLDAIQGTYQSISTQQKTDFLSTVTELASLNSQIVPVTDWDSNLKTVIASVLDRLGSENSDWTTAQTSSLVSIANQCRFEGGLGVLLARAALNNNQYYNDGADCPGNNDDRSAESQNAARFSIYPNPVSETCIVNLEKPENGICRIYTLDGKLVLTKTFEHANIVEINTAQLATGLYFLNLEFESGFKSSSKLEVIH